MAYNLIEILKELENHINSRPRYGESGGCGRGCCPSYFGQVSDGDYISLDDIDLSIKVICPVCSKECDLSLDNTTCYSCDNSLID
jgi:hypothetical protein